MRAVLALLLLAATVSAAKAPVKAPAQAGAHVGTWDVKTTQMSANLLTGQFTAPQHLTMTRADGSVVQADRAVGNYKQKRISLYGNVSIHDVSGNFGLQSGAGAQSRGPATLTSDELFVNDTTHLYDAKGNVHYEQGDTTADSQTAHLNDATHELQLAGAVHVVQGDRTIDAQTAAYNTKTGEGSAQNNVRIEFPGVTPQIATPRPITVKGPKIP
jgi:lipopolysaccharide assembly outer membrane protein LptD (OstA)